MTAARLPGLGMRACHFAAGVSGSYLLAGMAWLGFREGIGWRIGIDWPGLEYFFHGLSVVVVFPFSLLISCLLFRFRNPGPGFFPLWKPCLAGAATAVMLWSDLGMWLFDGLGSSGPDFPGRDIVAALSPFSMLLSFSHLLVWGRRPRNSSRERMLAP